MGTGTPLGQALPSPCSGGARRRGGGGEPCRHRTLPKRQPRPPSTLPGRSLERQRPAGLWQRPENPHGLRDWTGRGLRAAFASIRGPGMSRPSGTEGLLRVPSVANPQASLFTFLPDPLEEENSAIWAAPREGIQARRRPSKNQPLPPLRGRPSCLFIIPCGEIHFHCPF